MRHSCMDGAWPNAWESSGETVSYCCVGAIMDESNAETLLKECLELYKTLGRMDEVISKLEDEGEKIVYVKSLGDLIGSVTFEFIRPLTEKFPSLRAPFK